MLRLGSLGFGGPVGRGTAIRLRAQGLKARFLRGGIDGWKAAGMPLADKAKASRATLSASSSDGLFKEIDMNKQVSPGWLNKLGLMGLGFCIIPAGAATANFDAARSGSPPEGWICGSTGGGTPRWSVEADPQAPSKPNVLKQSGRGRYPWCVKADSSAANGWVEVKFKAVSGQEDQAGGIVWRWKNSDNYYVARANALENNLSLYYTKDGTRNTIKYQDAPVPLNVWHLLRVEFQDSRIKVSLNGKLYIEQDNQRISGSGKVGVWTKADSVTLFDDFTFDASRN